MNPSRRLLTNVLAGLAASLAFAVAAQAQPASAPPVPIRGCTTYLQMSDAQAKIINTDVARVAQIRNEREGKIAELQMQQLKEEELRLREERLKLMEQRWQSLQQRPPSSDSSSPATTGSMPGLASTPLPGSITATLPPEQMAAYEQQVIKIEVGLRSKRKKLADIERAYRRCIEKPPQAAKEEEAVPTAKKPAKRG